MRTPARYKNVKYSEVPKDIQKIYSEIPTHRKGLYIHGNVGVGKTYIIYALANSQTLNFKQEVWNVTELLEDLRLEMDRDKYDKKRTQQYLLEFNGVLFLDDIGAEKISDWVLEKLYMIINKRYEEMLPTIYTSNCTIQELAERVGDRIASRIVESCFVIKKEGKDRRLSTTV